jgi:hypothetical protein
MNEERHTRSTRLTHQLAAAAVVCGFGLGIPVAAQVANEPAAVDAYTLTRGRTIASGGAVAGLVGAVVGGLALARTARRDGTAVGRRRALAALTLGPSALVIGGLVVATADAGVGTGNGVAGGAVAIATGLIGVALGGLALSRSRRTA